MTVIGIDLGTTYSVVAYINKDGIAEVIPNERGLPLTPSVVNLGVNPPIVGDNAKDAQRVGDDNIHAFFKRDMGNTNAIYMEPNGTIYTPTDLSAFMLKHIKAYAEVHLATPITQAVITVPAYFKNDQRLATQSAGEQAGLNILRIINEPTAAALAYGIRPNVQTNGEKYLIYDLGGGTFDVTIAKIFSDRIDILGSDGDNQLGGKDWDDAILNYLASQFMTEFGVELYGDDFNALLVQAEETKKSLSNTNKKEVVVQAGGHVGYYTITRELFESLTSGLLQRTALLIDKALEDCSPPLTRNDLDGVVLVGGSTRMPMVKEFLTELVGKPPLSGVHPDQAVALGAAIQAQIDIESQSTSNSMPMLLAGRRIIQDITTHSLGMIAENHDRSKYINSIILPKNIKIPTVEQRPYTLRVNRRGETIMEAYMTQGELVDPQQCAYVGKYTFSDIPVQPGEKQVVIDVAYAYTHNGIVEVTAKERKSGKILTVNVESPPITDVPERFLQSPKEHRTEQQHVTVYLAFDMSGSMCGDPMNQAKKAALGFLEQIDLSSASMGLIEFSDETRTILKASQNAKEIRKAINGLTCGSTGYGNATDPFNEVFKLMGGRNTPEGPRFVVVLADGVWSDQPSAERRAKDCHREEIDVIGVGFGGADEAFLKRISSRQDLGFFVSLSTLVETFSTIAQELTESGGKLDNSNLSRSLRF